jgi:hypothetical protein
MFMTAWVFEVRHCPTLPNEIKKTKLDTNTAPQAGINILLCTVAQSTVTKQHGCQSLGCGLKSRGFGIGAAIRRTNLCFSLSAIMFPNSFGRL